MAKVVSVQQANNMTMLLIILGSLLIGYLLFAWFLGFFIWDLDAQKFNGEAILFIFITMPFIMTIFLMFLLSLFLLFCVRKCLTKDQDPSSLRL